MSDGEDFTDKAIKASNTGWATKLLGPSSKAIGDYLGEKVEDWIANQKKSNIDEHIDAVDKRMDSLDNASREPSANDAENLIQWKSSAEKYSSKEAEISSLWRMTLEKIRSGASESDLILETIGKLSPYDAKILFEIHQNRANSFNVISYGREIQNKSRLKKLIELGLIESYASFLARPFGMLIISINIVIFGTFSLLYLGGLSEFASRLNEFNRLALGIFGITYTATMFPFIAAILLRKRLSPFGKMVVRSALPYLNNLEANDEQAS